MLATITTTINKLVLRSNLNRWRDPKTLTQLTDPRPCSFCSRLLGYEDSLRLDRTFVAFTARRYTSAVYAVVVCLSVTPGTVQNS